MAVFKTNLTKSIIKKIIYENYGLKVKKIKYVNNGSANLFHLFCDDGAYMLKEYQEKFNDIDIEREYQIYQHLKFKDHHVPDYAISIVGKIFIIYHDKYITLQKYIKGKQGHFNKGNLKELHDSAVRLTEIINSMRDLEFQLPNYNLNLFESKEIENLNQKYLDLILSTNSKKIKTELFNKKFLLNKIKRISFYELEKMTILNSHGDYTVSQFIYNKDNSIDVVLDFITAKHMPIAWEIIRSYIYIDKKYRHGKFNIENFILYVKTINNLLPLNKYDLTYMIYIYYIYLLKSTFGYEQYICNKRNKKYLRIAKNNYWQCLFFDKNIEFITNRLLKEVPFNE